MSAEIYINGVLRERWSDGSRIYTAWDSNGNVMPDTPRPYTTQENALADGQALVVAQQNNATALNNDLTAFLTTLQTIIDTSNSTINSSPASYIKDLARVGRKLIRVVTRSLDGTN